MKIDSIDQISQRDATFIIENDLQRYIEHYWVKHNPKVSLEKQSILESIENNEMFSDSLKTYIRQKENDIWREDISDTLMQLLIEEELYKVLAWEEFREHYF